MKLEVNQRGLVIFFSSGDAAIFNDFIHDTGLIDLPMSGRRFTWMNKVGSKMSKLHRFLLSDDVIHDVPNLQVVALDRVWLDHNHILLHSKKYDFGPIPFNIFISWFDRLDFEDVVKEKWAAITNEESSSSKPIHTKLKDLKYHLKLRYSHTKDVEFSRRNFLLAELQDLENKMDDGHASDEEKTIRINRLQELDILEKTESMDLVQKARVKWEAFVVNFFSTSTLSQGSNFAFITLIPKVSNPLFIKDYRPISLISLHYKIVAKILANRLSKVIDSIISPEQSAFILGQQILDGPLILSEIIDWYKKCKKKLMLFKVDFEKAFDS
ncbi:RNA-directed DNA polymerase, eukaryota, reverse transcriptase zinc-binding domain protein, partial [Tanacetum coccineum]